MITKALSYGANEAEKHVFCSCSSTRSQDGNICKLRIKGWGSWCVHVLCARNSTRGKMRIHANQDSFPKGLGKFENSHYGNKSGEYRNSFFGGIFIKMIIAGVGSSIPYQVASPKTTTLALDLTLSIKQTIR